MEKGTNLRISCEAHCIDLTLEDFKTTFIFIIVHFNSFLFID